MWSFLKACAPLRDGESQPGWWSVPGRVDTDLRWIMSAVGSVHDPDQTTFPKSFKLEAVDQVLAGTPLRHVAETLDIAGSLLDKWKRQHEQQGDDAFQGNGKQRGESAELCRLRQQLAQVTVERDVLKKAISIFSQPTK